MKYNKKEKRLLKEGWRQLGPEEITKFGDYAPYSHQFMPNAHRGTKVSHSESVWGPIWRHTAKPKLEILVAI